MRCRHKPVGKTPLSIRSSRDPNPRCLRNATSTGYCRQHSRRCHVRWCTDFANKHVEHHWFCPRHAKLYVDHYRIVAKILTIPLRD